MTGDRDEAVRGYLDDLRRRTRGGDQLQELDALILRTHNPIERMTLVERRRRLAERRRLLEEEFVRHVGGWADTARIQRAAFEAEGVPQDLLDRAGVVG